MQMHRMHCAKNEECACRHAVGVRARQVWQGSSMTQGSSARRIPHSTPTPGAQQRLTRTVITMLSLRVMFQYCHSTTLPSCSEDGVCGQGGESVAHAPAGRGEPCDMCGSSSGMY